MSRSTAMISEGEVSLARNYVITSVELVKGTMALANDVERCFAAGMMCVTSYKIARELERFGVTFDE